MPRDPIMEEVIELIGDRGNLSRGEARNLMEEIEEDNGDLIYEEIIGPAVDKVEDVLTKRREGNEIEEE